MKKFSQRLKVRSYELDAQGHVNYAVFLNKEGKPIPMDEDFRKAFL